MEKLTISMAIFNSYVSLPEGTLCWNNFYLSAMGQNSGYDGWISAHDPIPLSGMERRLLSLALPCQYMVTLW